MKKQFQLGQEVVIGGKYVINPVSRAEVDEVESRIKETGEPESSKKYSVEKFEVEKHGIITGIRSIVGRRIHYLDSTGQVVTKTIRRPAYLVATDLRGLCYVPANMVAISSQTIDEIEELERENYRLNSDLQLAINHIAYLEDKLDEYMELFEDDDDDDEFDFDDLDDELEELEDELVNA